MIEIDIKKTKSSDVYKLMIGSIIPRPIAWISTQSKNGIGNLAPFSFFNGVSSNPPCLSVSLTRNSKGQKKDTLINIEDTKEFCVNIVSEDLAQQMNQTSAEYSFETDESVEVGIKMIPCKKIKALRVEKSLIQIECKYHSHLEVGNGGVGSATLIIGEIIYFNIDESIYQDGKILSQTLKPIARLAGSQYSKLGEVFTIDRPKI